MAEDKSIFYRGDDPIIPARIIVPDPQNVTREVFEKYFGELSSKRIEPPTTLDRDFARYLGSLDEPKLEKEWPVLTRSWNPNENINTFIDINININMNKNINRPMAPEAPGKYMMESLTAAFPGIFDKQPKPVVQHHSSTGWTGRTAQDEDLSQRRIDAVKKFVGSVMSFGRG